MWTRPCESEQLRQELRANFDYVLTYRMNEDFARRFASLFSDPAQIGPNRIYKVDHDTGQLTLCG